jgi:glucosylceramidase
MLNARFQSLFTSLVTFGLLAGCSSTTPPGSTGGTGSSSGGGGGTGSQTSTTGSTPTSGAVSSGAGGTGASAGTTTSGAGGSGVASTGGGTGASAGAGGTTGGTTGTAVGGTGASSGTGGTSTPGAYKTVAVVETSLAGGAAGVAEHCASLAALTPKAAAASTGTVITVDPTMQRQKITGFGGALTEVVASTIGILAPAQQTEIYNALWSPTGSNYTMTRTHIGGCDFSLSAYSYDDNGGTADPTLANFSIKNDMDYLIPGLKQAMTASGGTLKILGSMWSAPPWMKSPAIYNGGSVQAKYYGALASYFSKYVQAYKAQNLDIWAITPQNEPLNGSNARESDVWSTGGADMNTFIKTNLGPQFQTDGLSTKIFIYDHNNGPNNTGNGEILWAKTILGDTTTSPFVAGTAVHWYGSTVEVYEAGLDGVHAANPAKDILFDEGTADGFIFGGGENSQRTISAAAQIAAAWQNDNWFWNIDEYDWGWDYPGVPNDPDHVRYAPVTRYARDIIVGLNHWYTGWIDWNAVLNKAGAQDAVGGGIGTAGPNPVAWNPPGTAAVNTRGNPGVSHIENGLPASIMVDEDPTMTGQTGTIYYTPIFYVMRQVSKYILPGATVLLTTSTAAAGGDNTTVTSTQKFYATAAQNPDGTTAVVMFNSATTPAPYTVNVGSQSVTGSMPGQSVQTLIWQ